MARRNVTRVGDISMGICSVGENCCPHQWTSVHVSGSSNVLTNGRQTMRAPMDIGVSNCPHCITSFSVTGSRTVIINNRMTHRLGDKHDVACGTGHVVSASSNVIAGG